VVPVHNGDQTVGDLHERLARVLGSLSRPFEIILVDDASSDASWPSIAALAHANAHTAAVRLARKLGQGNATIVGLGFARGRFVVTLDDDLQHPPEELPKLLAELEARDALDVVCSKPQARRHDWWRRAASWSLNLLASAILLKSPFLRFSAFRVMRRPVSDWLAAQRLHRPVPGALLLQYTRRIDYVRTRHERSRRGASRYGLRELTLVWVGYFQALKPVHLLLVAAGSMLALAVCAWQLLGSMEGGRELRIWPGLAGAFAWATGVGAAGLTAFGSVACAWRAHTARALPPLDAAIATVIAAGGPEPQPFSAAAVPARPGG
jgi:dolichol-phosphate mannosyltransferase/undecaprenyl-phosphate 4-deoxy-4-formamido-L-arabinose transferase